MPSFNSFNDWSDSQSQQIGQNSRQNQAGFNALDRANRLRELQTLHYNFSYIKADEFEGKWSKEQSKERKSKKSSASRYELINQVALTGAVPSSMAVNYGVLPDEALDIGIDLANVPSALNLLNEERLKIRALSNTMELHQLLRPHLEALNNAWLWALAVLRYVNLDPADPNYQHLAELDLNEIERLSELVKSDLSNNVLTSTDATDVLGLKLEYTLKSASEMKWSDYRRGAKRSYKTDYGILSFDDLTNNFIASALDPAEKNDLLNNISNRLSDAGALVLSLIDSKVGDIILDMNSAATGGYWHLPRLPKLWQKALGVEGVDPTVINPEFKEARDNTDVSLFDPSTYLYSISHLGSSMAEWKGMLLTAGVGLVVGAVEVATGGAATPLLATSEAAFNLYMTNYFRHRETAAEAISNYSEKILNELDPDTPNKSKFHTSASRFKKILDEYSDQLKGLGAEVDHLEPLEIIQLGIGLDLTTSDEEYNKLTKDALYGLEKLEAENNALSVSDYIENITASYFGRAVTKGVFEPVVSGLSKASSKIGLTTAYNTVAKYINKKALVAAESAIKNPITRDFGKELAKELGLFVVHTGKTYEFEGLEEGVQWFAGERYKNMWPTDEDRETEYNLLEGTWDMLKDGLQSQLAWMGLHPNNEYNTNDELQKSMRIGATVGVIMGSSSSVIAGLRDANKLSKTFKTRELAAQGIENQEDNDKASQYMRLFHKGVSLDRIKRSIDLLKLRKGEGVTDEMIDLDKRLAEDVYAMYKSKEVRKTLKELGIKVGSDSHHKYVHAVLGLLKRSKDAHEESERIHTDLTTAYNKLLEDEDNPLSQLIRTTYAALNDELKTIKDKNGNKHVVTLNEYKRNVINSVIHNELLSKLKDTSESIETLRKLIQQISDDFGLRLDKSGIDAMLEEVNQFTERVEKEKRPSLNIKNLVDNELIQSAVSDIVTKTVALQLTDGVEASLAAKFLAMTQLTLDPKFRYLVQQKPLFRTLSPEQKANVLEEYTERYKNEHKTEKDPTITLVVKFYDSEVNKEWDEMQKSANQSKVGHTIAKEVIRQEIQRLDREASQSRREISEEIGRNITKEHDYDEADPNRSALAPTASPENPAPEQSNLPKPGKKIGSKTKDQTAHDQGGTLQITTTENPDVNNRTLVPSTEEAPGNYIQAEAEPEQETENNEVTEQPINNLNQLPEPLPENEDNPNADLKNIAKEPKKPDDEPPASASPEPPMVFKKSKDGKASEPTPVNLEVLRLAAEDQSDILAENDALSLDSPEEDVREYTEDSLRAAALDALLGRPKDENRTQKSAEHHYRGKRSGKKIVTRPVAEYISDAEKSRAEQSNLLPKPLVNDNPTPTTDDKLPITVNKISVEIPVVDQETNETYNVTEEIDPAQTVFTDGESFWTGNPNKELGKKLTIEEVYFMQDFQETAIFGDMLKSLIESSEIGKNQNTALDTKEKVEINRIWGTLFYQPTAEEVIEIKTIRGKTRNKRSFLFRKMRGTKLLQRKSGSELSKKLSIPGWFSSKNVRVHYIVTDSYGVEKALEESKAFFEDELDEKEIRKNNLAIHLIIEERDGDTTNVYNASMYTLSTALEKLNRPDLNLTEEQINNELAKLKAARDKIIDAYVGKYAKGYFEGKKDLPFVDKKSIKPTNLRVSNGRINSQRRTIGDIGLQIPIYRSLTGVAEFGLASDPIEMTNQILSGEVEFGYGRGPFAAEGAEYEITQLGDSENRVNANGRGLAGLIYIVVKAKNTPSLHTSVPIQLRTKPHTLSKGELGKNDFGYSLINGKLLFNKGNPVNTAELIFALVTRIHDGMNDPSRVAFYNAILNLLVNHGTNTVTVGDHVRSKYSFLVRKTLNYEVSESDGCGYLFYAGKNNRGDYYIRSLKIRDKNGNVVCTDSLMKVAVTTIASNLHWNTDRLAMVESIPQPIIDLCVDTMKRHNSDKVTVNGCKELTFTLDDFGLIRNKNGEIVQKEEGTTPLLITWMINHGILMTDVGEHAFKHPFIYDGPGNSVKIENTTEDLNEQNETVEEKLKPTEPLAKSEEITELQQLQTEQEIEGQITIEHILTAEEVKESGRKNIPGQSWVRFSNGDIDVIPNSELPADSRKLFSTVKGEGKVDLSTAKQWLQETLGLSEDDVVVTESVIKLANSPEAYGVMLVVFDRIASTLMPQIVLSEQAGEGIEYHEAFHYVSQLLLTEEQRNALYDELANRSYKYAGLTKDEAEEMLAEEFRNYMLHEQNPSLGYRVMKFFKSIVNVIRSLAGKRLNMSSKLFNDIRNGKFKKYKVDPKILEEFNLAHPEGLQYYAPGFTNDEQKQLPSIADAKTLYDVVDALTSSAMSTISIRSINDIKNINLDDIFNQISNRLKRGSYNNNEANKAIISDVVKEENRALFKRKIQLNLHNLGIRAINNIDADNELHEMRDTGETPENLWSKESYEMSKKLTTTFSAKLFFSSVVDNTFLIGEDGNKILSPKMDSIFGLSKTVPFNIAWNKIMNSLWESSDWSDLMERVGMLADVDPFFSTLQQMLSDENLNEETKTQILVTIQSAKNSLDLVDVNSNRIDIMDSDNLTLIARLPRQWSLNFIASGLIITDEQGNTFVDSSALDRSRIPELRAKILNFIKTGSKKNYAFEDAKKDFITILNLLGIPFDLLALDKLINNISKECGNVTQEWVFKMIFGSDNSPKHGGKFPLQINSSILKNILSMASAKSISTSFKGNTVSVDRIFNSKDPNAVINRMAAAYAQVHPSPEELSVFGPDSKIYYPITENNFMSDLLRWLNNNLYGKLGNILEASYSKHSLIAQHLSNPNNPRLKIHALIGIRDLLRKKDYKYYEISPLDDYMIKLALASKGRLLLPTIADKPSWYTIDGMKLPTSVLTNIRYSTDIVTGITTTTTGERRFSDDVLNVFYNYLLDEFNAITQYYNTKEFVEKDPSKAVKNYHGKIVNGKMLPGGNGGRFRYFGILGEHNLNDMLQMAEQDDSIAGISNSDENSKINKVLSTISSILTDSKDTILDDLNSLLLDRTRLEIENARNLGVFSLTASGLRYNPALDEIFKDEPLANLSDEDKLYTIFGNFVTSYAISIEEFEKCFTGDPAMYKWISYNGKVLSRDVDKIKRTIAVMSTGKNLRLEWDDGDPRNNTKFTTLTIKDNMVSTPYYNALYDTFFASNTRAILKRLYPLLTDAELFERTSTMEKCQQEYADMPDEYADMVYNLTESSIRPYEPGAINQSDSAVYIRPALYRRILEALGEWNDEIAEAFNILEDDNSLTNSEAYRKASLAVIKPLKMVYFGESFDSSLGLNTPTFDKMAIFPMFKVLCRGDNRILYDRMNNESLGTIDMIKFESAVKVGSPQDIHSVYFDEENTKLNTKDLNKKTSTVVSEDGTEQSRLDKSGGVLTTRVQDLKHLRLQLNTDPHEETERSFGTQAVKIMLSNIVDDRVYSSGKTGSQIKSLIFNIINELSNKATERLLDRFSDPLNLTNYLKRIAIQQGLDDEVASALDQIARQVGDGTYNANDVTIAALSERNWFESSVISLINKAVIDVNTPGGSAIQMPFFGFKKTQIKTKVPKPKDGIIYNNGNPLSFDPSKGSMEIMLSINFFKHFIPENYRASFSSMRKWLFVNGIIGNDAKPFGIGYRIPTQGNSSTFGFVVADVFPENVGDTIVVPDEFTALTGSDFDIDKIYLATYHFSKDKSGKTVRTTDNSEGGLTNQLLDAYLSVITDPKTIAETRNSIDAVTGIVKSEIVPLILSIPNVEASPMYELMPSFLILRKLEYVGGRAGIAPFALHSTNHTLTQAVHLTMKYTTAVPLGPLDAIYDKDGIRILDWLSAMINANADVAADPYINTINVNEVTWNVCNLLLRGGYGKSTFLFLSLPVIKELALMTLKSRGIFGIKASTDSILRTLENKYTERYRSLVDKETFVDTMTSINKKEFDQFTDGELFTRALKEFRDDGKLSSAESAMILLYALRMWQDLQHDASTLNLLVQVSQIDTKKYGKNMSLLLNFYNKYINFINRNKKSFSITTDPNNASPLETYFKNTFLQTKLDNLFTVATTMLRDQSFSATSGYSLLLTSVLRLMFDGKGDLTQIAGLTVVPYKTSLSNERFLLISNRIEQIVRAAVFGNQLLSDEELVGMTIGDNPIARLLNTFKLELRSHPEKYPTLVDGNGNIINEALNYLQGFYSTDGRVSKITLASSSLTNDAQYTSRLKSAFYDLLYHEDPYVSDFAKKLVLYTFMSTYDARTTNGFFNLIPLQYKLDISYVSRIHEAVSLFKNIGTLDIFIDLETSINDIVDTLARNFWFDDNIVLRYVAEKDYNGHSRIITIGNIEFQTQRGRSYTSPTMLIIPRKPSGLYIKYLNEYIAASNDYTNLYKFAGVFKAEWSKKDLYVYVITPKLGYNRNNEHIYELNKSGADASAFNDNNLPNSILQLLSVDGITDAIKKQFGNSEKVTFIPDDSYSNIAASATDSFTDVTNRFGNIMPDPTTNFGLGDIPNFNELDQWSMPPMDASSLFNSLAEDGENIRNDCEG